MAIRPVDETARVYGQLSRELQLRWKLLSAGNRHRTAVAYRRKCSDERGSVARKESVSETVETLLAKSVALRNCRRTKLSLYGRCYLRSALLTVHNSPGCSVTCGGYFRRPEKRRHFPPLLSILTIV